MLGRWCGTKHPCSHLQAALRVPPASRPGQMHVLSPQPLGALWPPRRCAHLPLSGRHHPASRAPPPAGPAPAPRHGRLCALGTLLLSEGRIKTPRVRTTGTLCNPVIRKRLPWTGGAGAGLHGTPGRTAQVGPARKTLPGAHPTLVSATQRTLGWCRAGDVPRASASAHVGRRSWACSPQLPAAWHRSWCVWGAPTRCSGQARTAKATAGAR